jgi:hypothetical protein
MMAFMCIRANIKGIVKSLTLPTPFKRDSHCMKRMSYACNKPGQRGTCMRIVLLGV